MAGGNSSAGAELRSIASVVVGADANGSSPAGASTIVSSWVSRASAGAALAAAATGMGESATGGGAAGAGTRGIRTVSMSPGPTPGLSSPIARSVTVSSTLPSAIGASATVSSSPSPVNQDPRQYSRSCTKVLAVW